MKSYYRVLAEIKSKYNIDIVAGGDRLELEVGYNEAAPMAVRDYVEFFLYKELSVYSNELIRKSKVERIVVCKNLASLGRRCSGLADMKVLLVPFRKNSIYLSARQSKSNYDRATIHHEIFHAIDFHDDWSRYSDFEWPKLNVPQFKYGEIVYENNLPHDEHGFFSVHGTSAVHEDKAEIYAHMMVNYSGVEKRASGDPIVKAKMIRMKELLQKFCPDYDDAFWRQRERVSVPVY